MKFINKHIKLLATSCLGVLLVVSCTDLEVEQTDSILSPNFEGLSAEEASSTLDGAYNSLRGYIGSQGDLFALSEVTADALLIPTRGSDWGDNGLWRELHQHAWKTDHQFIGNVWNNWNQLQLTASEILDERSQSSAADRAQASFLRGLAVFVILDNFGQVPFRDTAAPPLEDPAVLTGQAAVDFIIADLNAAISGLPSDGAGSDNSRATQSAARYLLAKVMLNKHIYLGNGSADNADMAQVISLVEAIESDGYELVEGYFDIFKSDADNETIWYVPTSVGNRIFNTLHYNSTNLGGGGWNGFSTLAEYYDLFEGDPNSNPEGGDQEERRGYVPTAGIPIADAPPGSKDDDPADGFADGSNVGYGFLIGQQYALDGSALTDRNGQPLAFERDFVNAANGSASLTDNNEVTGIRVIKYNPTFGAFAEHEIFFRYSDAYLMKAEAMMRSGQDVTAMINVLRELRKATPLASVSEQDLLDERARELYAEFWRRNDLIRFGQYTRDWDFKNADAVNNADRQLFPIPASQVILNPNLVQNPGY
ncbi:RagB/SusD family nutrient uptake outer membrane protein [Sediminicola luteus]|uniref:RagB/SusD family nutrient uptake outer membrane protein n=1 Tax=Sediminicola luteus TaxID=319238 RepID=A0A2A4GDT7_9FLAO|nr:RagB/SusD family nutrient uptake outer membrane protein [Sediminicola luteus]PCE65955.1 RagB/SusD family nutrient uptake outer membrane protein [Sediminicola luteus]